MVNVGYLTRLILASWLLWLIWLPAGLRASDELAIQRGPFSSSLLLSGQLVAEEAVILMVPNTGIWPVQIRWLVEDGTEVAAGDRIVEFDNSQLVRSLETAEAEVRSQANELDTARASAADAEYKAVYEVQKSRAEVQKAKLKADIPADLRTEQEHSANLLNLRKMTLELAQAEAALVARKAAEAAAVEIQLIAFEKARESYQRAAQNLELLDLRAPRAGIVLVAEDQREGRTFQTGDNAFPGNPVARLPNLDTLLIEAQLFDVDDGKIAPGQEVVAVLDTFPDLEWRGEIREINNVASETSRRSTRRSFLVLIALEAPDTERMLPGMSVKVRVEQESSEQVLIPRAALNWQDDEVFAALANGSLAEVELGPCNAQFCVLESGPAVGTALTRKATGDE